MAAAVGFLIRRNLHGSGFAALDSCVDSSLTTITLVPHRIVIDPSA